VKTAREWQVYLAMREEFPVWPPERPVLISLAELRAVQVDAMRWVAEQCRLRAKIHHDCSEYDVAIGLGTQAIVIEQRANAIEQGEK